MFFRRRAGYLLIDRGDVAAYDFTIGNLTCNNAWQDLDLSSILPSNAKFVLIRLVVKSTLLNDYMYMRKKGNSNEINVSEWNIPTANSFYSDTVFVSISNTGILQYKIPANFNTVDIVVVGWLL